MPGVKAAIIVFALLTIVVVPLLVIHTHRLNKHDRRPERDTSRTAESE